MQNNRNVMSWTETILVFTFYIWIKDCLFKMPIIGKIKSW